MMDKELYKQELWASLDQSAANLYYLDHFRDRQKMVEPLYRGALGMMAIMTAVAAFFDMQLFTKTVAVITALMATVPVLIPVMPQQSDFHEMSRLRIAVSEWLVSLEQFWQDEWTDEQYRNYCRMKSDYRITENALSDLFGKISVKLTAKAHKDANRYLDRFFTSSPEA